MESPTRIVISASRRTDIPAFYMKWFMKQIEKGIFEITNPYNKRVSILPSTPEKVHTIVFWSKNFDPFINEGYGDRLKEMGYHLFFNFTLNSDSPRLEPNVPPLEKRLDQLDVLTDRFAPETITWRFDPICFYQTEKRGIRDNFDDFPRIAHRASQNGISRCITSFMDDYPQIQKRVRKINESIPGFSFVDPGIEKKKKVLLAMEQELKGKNIQLQTCCEKRIINVLPASSAITQSACIPNDLLIRIFGGCLSLKKDAGQRINKGCGCMVSVDIGSYHMQPCHHNCLFCYANPSI